MPSLPLSLSHSHSLCYLSSLCVSRLVCSLTFGPPLPHHLPVY